MELLLGETFHGIGSVGEFKIEAINLTAPADDSTVRSRLSRPFLAICGYTQDSGRTGDHQASVTLDTSDSSNQQYVVRNAGAAGGNANFGIIFIGY